MTSWVNSATAACCSLCVWATGGEPASEAGFARFALAPLSVLSGCRCALGRLSTTSEGVGDEELSNTEVLVAGLLVVSGIVPGPCSLLF